MAPFVFGILLARDPLRAIPASDEPTGDLDFAKRAHNGSNRSVQEGGPLYAVIPLDSGDLSPSAIADMSLDANGELIAYVGRDRQDLGPLETPIQFLERLTGAEHRVAVDLGASLGQTLSKDGERFFFLGSVRRDLIHTTGIAMLSLQDADISVVLQDGLEFFSVDREGRRIVFQSYQNLDPRFHNDEPALRYFFYDKGTGEIRRLTTDPLAAFQTTSSTFCPQTLGTTPLITADGNRIVLVTSVTLGLIDQDPRKGCHIFVYDVSTAAWHHAASLSKGISLSSTTLSNDGRWLSFTSIRTDSEGILRGFPALLDLETGDLIDPIGGIAGYTSFDSVVSGDASTVVISSQADLDPRVGNPDHNLELFAYDRESEVFTQMTDTVGGVGSTPGGCPSHRPKVNDDGTVAVFASHRYSVEGCHLDGPLRQRDTGFSFARVRAVRKRPGNQGPTLEPPSDVQVTAGDTVRLELSANDPDGDPIYYFAQEVDAMDIPPGSEMTDHRDGTATFEWSTTDDSLGTWRLRVAAFDEGGGQDFHDVVITITAPCAGDCDRDGQVTVDELVTAINIALGVSDLSACRTADTDSGEGISVAELVAAAGNSIHGCRD